MWCEASFPYFPWPISRREQWWGLTALPHIHTEDLRRKFGESSLEDWDFNWFIFFSEYLVTYISIDIAWTNKSRNQKRMLKTKHLCYFCWPNSFIQDHFSYPIFLIEILPVLAVHVLKESRLKNEWSMKRAVTWVHWSHKVCMLLFPHIFCFPISGK